MGVCSVTVWCGGNKYYIDGKEVKREEVYDYVAKKLGKTFDKNIYYPKPKRPHH